MFRDHTETLRASGISSPVHVDFAFDRVDFFSFSSPFSFPLSLPLEMFHVPFLFFVYDDDDLKEILMQAICETPI